MNWLSTAYAFTAALSLVMAGRILGLNTRSSLNRKLALAYLLVGLMSLADSLLGEAPNARLFWAFFKAEAILSYLSAPVIMAALLDFSGIQGKWRSVLNAPSVAIAAFQSYMIVFESWIVAGYRQTIWGNAIVDSRDPAIIAFVAAFYATNTAVGLVAIVYGWGHAPSPGYRKIIALIVALGLLVNIWAVFWSTIAQGLGLPDLTDLCVGIVLIAFAYLMRRHRGFTEGRMGMAGHLLSCLRGTLLFADRDGIVIEAPEGALRLLGADTEGKELAAVLEGSPDMAREWEAMKADLLPRADLRGTIGEARFRIQLLPQRTPFDEFDGALVCILPQGEIDATLSMLGLSTREEEVARLVCEGFGTGEIAEGLHISPSTVKNHLHNLYTKTGTSGRSDLVRVLLAKAPGP